MIVCPEPMRHYIQEMKASDLIPELRASACRLRELTARVDERKGQFRYAADKWSVAEVLQHVIDSERIFAYRALRIARKDPGVLSSFDENVFGQNADVSLRSVALLDREFALLRETTVMMFETFTIDQLGETAPFAGGRVSVEVLGLLLSGHLRHHLKILETRYGI